MPLNDESENSRPMTPQKQADSAKDHRSRIIGSKTQPSNKNHNARKKNLQRQGSRKFSCKSPQRVLS